MKIFLIAIGALVVAGFMFIAVLVRMMNEETKI